MSKNLYDILGVKFNCSNDDIKTAYRQLVKIYHPDKPTGDAKIFEMISDAYEQLNDPEKRSHYDILCNIIKKKKSHVSHHYDLKQRFSEYNEILKNMDAGDNDESMSVLDSCDKGKVKINYKETSEKSFKNTFAEMDKKHGLNREEMDKISEKDAHQKYKNLKSKRTHENLENTIERLFEPDQFNLAKFNSIWDKVYKEKEHDELISKNEPIAWNLSSYSNYGSLDKYDSLYSDNSDIPFNNNKGSHSYANFEKHNDIKVNITKDDVFQLQDADYTFNYNKKEENYENILQQRILDRKQETELLDKIEDTNGFGNFGILDDPDLKDLIAENNELDELMKKYKNIQL